MIASLNHPHICTLHDIGHYCEMTYLVMEFLEGETLKQKIAGRPLPIDQLLELAVQISEGLECAHENGIIHRDVKPSNVFVTKRGDAKLLDFGISKAIHPDAAEPEELTRIATITQNGQVVGTTTYMSPEQIQGQPVDARSDIFSFGAVLYEMATGVRAFDGNSMAAIMAEVLRGQPKPPTNFNPELPQDFQRIVAKALEKDPGERYQSATELKIDLCRLRKRSSSETSAVQAASPAPHSRPSAKALRYGALMAAGLALTLAVLLTPVPSSGPLDSRQITFSPEPKDGPIFTDGTRLYFTSSGELSQMAVTGGTIATTRILQPGMQLLDLSADGSQLLALKLEGNNEINFGLPVDGSHSRWNAA